MGVESFDMVEGEEVKVRKVGARAALPPPTHPLPAPSTCQAVQMSCRRSATSLARLAARSSTPQPSLLGRVAPHRHISLSHAVPRSYSSAAQVVGALGAGALAYALWDAKPEWTPSRSSRHLLRPSRRPGADTPDCAQYPSCTLKRNPKRDSGATRRPEPSSLRR